MYRKIMLVLVAALLVVVLVLMSPFRTPEAETIVQPGEAITLDLGSIVEDKGCKEYPGIAKLVVAKEKTKIMLKAEGEVTGDLKVAANAIVQIGNITILMPCAYYNTKSCVRIMMIIPGYDEPLEISKGTYPVSVKICWLKESGNGTLKLKLKVIEQESG
ncbi:MAG: hypothetical protein DRO23_01670 [Thermoprotei archaeon]|nr:MAG: hypothetical protein DRO23_01670 [Thermoprotei archaeon]